MPGFKTTFERYLAAVESLSYEFVRLVAEALGLVPDGLAQFFDARERMQHHAKLLKYPTRDEAASEQGIGPHFDAGFMTFVSPPLFYLQVSIFHSPAALALSSLSVEPLDNQ